MDEKTKEISTKLQKHEENEKRDQDNASLQQRLVALTEQLKTHQMADFVQVTIGNTERSIYRLIVGLFLSDIIAISIIIDMYGSVAYLAYLDSLKLKSSVKRSLIYKIFTAGKIRLIAICKCHSWRKYINIPPPLLLSPSSVIFIFVRLRGAVVAFIWSVPLEYLEKRNTGYIFPNKPDEQTVHIFQTPLTPEEFMNVERTRLNYWYEHMIEIMKRMEADISYDNMEAILKECHSRTDFPFFNGDLFDLIKTKTYAGIMDKAKKELAKYYRIQFQETRRTMTQISELTQMESIELLNFRVASRFSSDYRFLQFFMINGLPFSNNAVSQQSTSFMAAVLQNPSLTFYFELCHDCHSVISESPFFCQVH